MPDWSPDRVQQCLIPGATLSIVGSIGNAGFYLIETARVVKEFNDQQTADNKVSLEYRLFADQPPSNEDVEAAVAILQRSDTGGPKMLRVANEWQDTYHWLGLSVEERTEHYLRIQHTAYQAIKGSGGGIFLVDGMLDYWNPNYSMDQYINDVNKMIQANPEKYPGWTGWADTFDILAINGYFEPGRFGDFRNGQTLESVLARLPDGKGWRFSESGYKPPGGRPDYTDIGALENYYSDFVAWMANHEALAEKFAGFNIYTQDPHDPLANIADEIMQLMEKSPALYKALYALENFGLTDPGAFKAWVQKLLDDEILEECYDDEGNFLGYAPFGECESQFGLPQLPTPSNQCSAGGSIPSSGTFRPYPCANCSLMVPQGTKACADPFSVNARTQWTCGSLERCGDGTWLKYGSYGTNFTLDTRDTDVPFAGYNKVVTDQEENSLNLHYYLADYIGGTALYDGKPYNPLKPKQVTKMINEAGVFRKLAPLEVQDKLRADMILSGHNYEVTNGKTIKQMMDWWPEYPFPPKPYPAGRFPPLKSNPLYLPLYSAWLTTEWGRLWQRIPLFTREDSPGKITLSIEHDPGELSSANQFGQNKSYYSAEFPMAFPHLARLHDSSQTLQQMLVPKTHDNGTAAVPSPEKQITENKSENLAGKVLLAQAKIGEKNITGDSVDESDQTYQPPVLLAQGDEEDSPPPELPIVVIPSLIPGDSPGTYGWQYQIYQDESFPNYSAYDLADFAYTILVNGEVVGHGDRQPGCIAGFGCHIQSYYGGVDAPYFPLQPGPVTVELQISDGVFTCTESDENCTAYNPNRSYQTACTINDDGSFTCEGVALPSPPSPLDPGCSNQSNLDPACSGNSPREDNKPNDPICCNADVKVDVIDYRVIGYDSDEAYQKACVECDLTVDTQAECDERYARIHEVVMTRKVQVDLKIPYLENIWEDTAEDDWGVFNIFRPADWPAFPDYDALSRIRYTQESPQGVPQWIEWAKAPVWLSPSEGNLYFPYLGGIQQTKKCIAEHFLLPPELQSEVNYCQFWEEYLQSQPTYDPSIPPALDPSLFGNKPNTNPDLEAMLAAAEADSGVIAALIKGILAIEGASYITNPLSNDCQMSACGAVGPLQITAGDEFVNCDSSKGAICTNHCENGQIKESSQGMFNSWPSYADSSMSPCNLQDSLIVAGRMLRAKGGGSDISIDDKEKIVRAVLSYHGHSYDSNLSPADNCSKNIKYSRLNNMSYCEYALSYANISL